MEVHERLQVGGKAAFRRGKLSLSVVGSGMPPQVPLCGSLRSEDL